jgi:hypothetical protein
MSLHMKSQMRLAAGVLFVAATGCGGAERTTANTFPDAQALPDAGPFDARAPPTPADGSTGAEGDGATSCEALEKAAREAFEPLVDATTACRVDEDCVIVADWLSCLETCGIVINAANRAHLFAASAGLCEAFDQHGCKLFVHSCPAYSPVQCASGVCNWAPWCDPRQGCRDGGA